MFPFASCSSFSLSPPTAVTSTDGGTRDGTGLRRAPVPGVVGLPPLGGEKKKEEPPGVPSARASCDRPASHVGLGFSPPFSTPGLAGDVVDSRTDESTMEDEAADVSAVLALLEGSWRDRTPRGYHFAKGLFDSTRDWIRASSVEVVYTVRTGCGGSISFCVYYDEREGE